MARGALWVLQLNCHRKEDSNLETNTWMTRMDNSIGLLQEPGQQRGKILNIDRSNIKCYTGTPVNVSENERPRACILAKSKLNTYKMSQFCNRDQVAVALKDNSGSMICFASVYMPYDSREAPPPQLMQDLVTFCTQRNWRLIIGSDANSHNTMWGSTNDNLRGEQLLEYIVSTNLEICNVGNTPTFVIANRQEVIDVTLVSNNFLDNIVDWKVSDEDMQSDHRLITFNVLRHIYRAHNFLEVLGKLDGININGNLAITWKG